MSEYIVGSFVFLFLSAPNLFVYYVFHHTGHLDLSHSQISGTMPANICSLSTLEVLSFEGDSLMTGTIPTELALLDHLEVLNLAGTSITGTVSEEICEVHDLHTNRMIQIFVNDTDLPMCSCCLAR